jgi:hypothetical protein
MTDTSPTPPPQSDHPLAAIRPEGYFGGVELLASDVRVLSLFADEARRRSLQRLFGIPKTDKSGLVTLIVLLTAADAIRRGMEGVPSPSRPSPVGFITGVGLLKEVAYGVSGPWARDSPYFGTLLAFALVAGSARFVLRRSVRGAKSLSREARRNLNHRYGHLLRPNRQRAAS